MTNTAGGRQPGDVALFLQEPLASEVRHVADGALCLRQDVRCLVNVGNSIVANSILGGALADLLQMPYKLPTPEDTILKGAYDDIYGYASTTLSKALSSEQIEHVVPMAFWLAFSDDKMSIQLENVIPASAILHISTTTSTSTSSSLSSTDDDPTGTVISKPSRSPCPPEDRWPLCDNCGGAKEKCDVQAPSKCKGVRQVFH